MGKLLTVWAAIKRPVFNIYVALNMLLCSILFLGKSLPRETISGFIGRKTLTGFVNNPEPVTGLHRFYYYASHVIDFLHREMGHCCETAIAESEAYRELYPEHDHAGTIAPDGGVLEPPLETK